MDEKTKRALDACQAFIARIHPHGEDLRALKLAALKAIEEARGDAPPPLGISVRDGLAASSKFGGQ